MVLLYLSIPIMVIALAIATIPLLTTMRYQERARAEVPAYAAGADLDAEEELRPAA